MERQLGFKWDKVHLAGHPLVSLLWHGGYPQGLESFRVFWYFLKSRSVISNDHVGGMRILIEGEPEIYC